MINQKLFVASAIALIVFTGYKSPVFANTQLTTFTVAAASEKTSGFTSLQTVVSKTKAAVDAGKFAMAKDEFSKFEDSWKKVEDGLKKKSPDTYKAIEENMDMVKKEIKAAKPSKTKLVSALQSLDKAIAKAAKV
jgi:hypothetical protein